MFLSRPSTVLVHHLRAPSLVFGLFLTARYLGGAGYSAFFSEHAIAKLRPHREARGRREDGSRRSLVKEGQEGHTYTLYPPPLLAPRTFPFRATPSGFLAPTTNPAPRRWLTVKAFRWWAMGTTATAGMPLARRGLALYRRLSTYLRCARAQALSPCPLRPNREAWPSI